MIQKVNKLFQINTCVNLKEKKSVAGFLLAQVSQIP